MESLIADFVQFCSAFAKFLVLEGRLGTRLTCTQFWDFLKISSFPQILSFKLFPNWWGNLYLQLLVMIIILLPFTCSEGKLSLNNKSLKIFSENLSGKVASASHVVKSTWKLQKCLHFGKKIMKSFYKYSSALT